MKEDMRSLSQQTQHQIRKQVVRLKNQSRSSSEIAEITGLTRQSAKRQQNLAAL